MSTKRYKPEQIVNLLCRIEVEIANGKTTPQAAPKSNFRAGDHLGVDRFGQQFRVTQGLYWPALLECAVTWEESAASVVGVLDRRQGLLSLRVAADLLPGGRRKVYCASSFPRADFGTRMRRTGRVTLLGNPKHCGVYGE